jgi:hypothetical protein
MPSPRDSANPADPSKKCFLIAAGTAKGALKNKLPKLRLTIYGLSNTLPATTSPKRVSTPEPPLPFWNL